MVQEIALLMVTSLSFALGFGWLGQPQLLGYIATGMVLGPFFRQSQHYIFIDILGQFGMLMLLFMIGIEFNLKKFKKIWKEALCIFFAQLSFSFIIAFFLQYILQICLQFAVLLAFLFTLSSTAVVIKLLEEMDVLNTSNGSLIVSILIIQDLAIAPMIIILKGFQQQQSLMEIMLKILFSVGVLSLLIWYLSEKSNKIFKPIKVLFEQNQETMTLASLAICFGFAALSDGLGLSHSYGPFLAGLILGSFGNKHEIIHYAKPIGSILMMMFFIFIGSRIDLSYVWNELQLLIILSLVLVSIKLFMNYMILIFMGFSKKNSFFVSSMLSQASEFSFMFVAILYSAKVISGEYQMFLDTLIVISLTLGSILPVLAEYCVEFLDAKQQQQR